MNGSHNWYINFEEQADNFFNMIVSPLKDQGHEVDIFLSTYKFSDEKTKKLQDVYSPVSLSFIEFIENEERYSAQYRHHLNLYNNVLKYEVEQSKKYDSVITTRFDLEMNKKITEYPYNYSFFNANFKQPGGDVDDCFWIFPGIDLPLMISTLEIMNTHRVTLHKIEKYYRKPILFMVTVEEYTLAPFYNLKRTIRDNQWQY